MKMNTKTMKNWRAQAGFTLVELIVVIAILAILGGVAVPAYSGYVEKANKQADISLISEIEHALALAYYSGTIPAGEQGCVILSVGENPSGFSADSNVEKALLAAFGTGYAEQLQLKYDGWKGGVASVYTSFSNSSFKGNEDMLMGDIQDLTDAVGTFLDKRGTDFMQFMGGDAWTEFQQKHNIDMTDGKQVANSTALFVAEMTTNKVTDTNKDAFINAWCNANSTHTSTRHDITAGNFDEVGMGTLSNLAAHYARAEALASYIDAQNKATPGKYTLNMGNKADGTAYTSMKEWFADQGDVNGTNTKQVLDSMADVTAQFSDAMGGSAATILGDYLTSDQAKKDADAYLSMMGAINDHSTQLSENLNEGKLYEGGAANDLLNGYLAAGEAMTANGASVSAGSVGVVIIAGNDGYVLSVVGAN